MKKLIYSLSIAMACGFAADAAKLAQPQMLKTSQEIKAMQISQGPMQFERISSDGPRRAKRQAPKAEDFVGTYKWSARSQLTEEFFPNSGVMTITADEADPNKLQIVGFCASFEEDPAQPGYGFNSNAFPIPTIPATFSVPALLSLS